jgi:hypothetical protein
MKKIFRSKKQWQKILFAQPASGLSISQYCKNKNINISNFYAWRKRLSSHESPKLGFLRLNKPLFPTLKDLRIETPNGYKIEVNGFDESIFHRILGMIKSI